MPATWLCTYVIFSMNIISNCVQGRREHRNDRITNNWNCNITLETFCYGFICRHFDFFAAKQVLVNERRYYIYILASRESGSWCKLCLIICLYANKKINWHICTKWILPQPYTDTHTIIHLWYIAVSRHWHDINGITIWGDIVFLSTLMQVHNNIRV